jgi:hypothetical protein
MEGVRFADKTRSLQEILIGGIGHQVVKVGIELQVEGQIAASGLAIIHSSLMLL